MIHTNWKGSRYDAGFHYGATLRENNRNPLEHIPLDSSKMEFAEKCVPVYKEVYPEILEEIRGISDGLQMNGNRIAHFLFSMYCYTFDNKCSCFAFSGNGKTVFARNSDFAASVEEFCDSPHYQLQKSYSFIGNTTAWTEIEDGVNEHGLAAGLTFIYPTKIKPGINAGMLVRYLLEKCRSAEDAIQAICQLPLASPQTITLADKSGDTAVVECNCEKVVVRRPQDGCPYVFTTNHFISEEMQEFQYGGIDDCRSHERYETLFSAFRDTPENPLMDAKEVLSGKKGFLCQYDRSQGLDTVWSVVYDLTDAKFYRAEGNPSREPFQEDMRLSYSTSN